LVVCPAFFLIGGRWYAQHCDWPTCPTPPQQLPATETGVHRVRSLVRSFDLVGSALLMMGTVALLLPLKYGGTKMAWDARV
jgi:hypothetical protein